MARNFCHAEAKSISFLSKLIEIEILVDLLTSSRHLPPGAFFLPPLTKLFAIFEEKQKWNLWTPGETREIYPFPYP